MPCSDKNTVKKPRDWAKRVMAIQGLLPGPCGINFLKAFLAELLERVGNLRCALVPRNKFPNMLLLKTAHLTPFAATAPEPAAVFPKF